MRLHALVMLAGGFAALLYVLAHWRRHQVVSDSIAFVALLFLALGAAGLCVEAFAVEAAACLPQPFNRGEVLL